MSAATATGARIEIRGLTKRFGSFVAVDDLSFDVEPGRITGFLGPNGAGKTTTLRMLLGLVHQTERDRDDRRAALRRPRPRPQQTVGAALEATNFHPGRSGRDHLRVLADAGGDPARRGSTSCSSSPASRRRRASGPASTAWACASASAWRPRCSATPRCSSSTSPPTAWTPRASAGCAASCATSAARARRSSSRATCSRRSSRPSTRSSSSPTAASCGRARWPSCAARRGALVRTSDPERLAGALRVADVTSTPAPDGALVADTVDLRLIGDVALRAGLPIYGLEARRADLEALFFELTEGTNRNETPGAPRRAGRRARRGRGEPVIPAIRSEFRKFFTTRMWWGMAIAIFVAGAGFAALFGFLFTSERVHERRGPGQARPIGDATQIASSVYTGGPLDRLPAAPDHRRAADRLRVPPQDGDGHLPRDPAPPAGHARQGRRPPRHRGALRAHQPPRVGDRRRRGPHLQGPGRVPVRVSGRAPWRSACSSWACGRSSVSASGSSSPTRSPPCSSASASPGSSSRSSASR